MVPFSEVIKKDIRIEVFYLKVWITLLNEMLQLLFVPRRHLCGYFLVLVARVMRLRNTAAGRAFAVAMC